MNPLSFSKKKLFSFKMFLNNPFKKLIGGKQFIMKMTLTVQNDNL